MGYTVKQLSRLAGVSVRTLHYYDEISILKPTSLGSNGYRYYGEEALIKLQQILFYRELELSLDGIRRIMDNPSFDLTSALESHKEALKERIVRMERLIRTVDNTLSHLKGQKDMTDKQLFSAFTDDEQEKYALEAEKMYDPEIVRASNRIWKSYSAEKKTQILEEGNKVYTDILAKMHLGAESDEVQACVERWRRHMDYFWTPSLKQLVGLAEGYNNHPGFKANFDKIDPRLAGFMLQAVNVYVEKNDK
ncbi:MAG: MerR family transcriptional regulator [Chloroflexi bacterium GWB2_49_20]|nr:MAG: MerR family transcriptional regulator [Chloroflexi bacterium GWB2_49_20]OGN78656.1 MAG: MerR family transcriptional regulator [Chloroflexi bacterium GWC2_49_37]OGN85758.1 MAG: MerR family transcriptional regulator [Chloroflexi bacterium GWD2_49_16]HBG75050.1 MerR family transcriptional regulator [Anaerolineae bacterium]HCC78076.1 MerR family transcriptional regulator [Anaerolineae bacterium]